MTSLPAADTIDRPRGKGPLLALALLFAAPLVAAWLILHFGWYQAGIANRGELLAAGDSLDRHGIKAPVAGWLLIYHQPDPCLDDCQQQLALLQRSWLALGREQPRVALLLLTKDGASVANPLKLPLYPLAVAPEQEPYFANALLIADPLGNLVMRYPLTASNSSDQFRALLADLRRLLRNSRVG